MNTQNVQSSRDCHKPNGMLLFAGSSNPELAAKVSNHLEVPLGEMVLDQFNDGEIRCEVLQNVRDCDVYILQSTCYPVNDNIMELLVMTDALKRASARRITAVMPYYGYARQDRKDKIRSPISARLVADLLEASGVDRIVSMDLHCGQIQGFFNIPMDHLYASAVLVNAIKDIGIDFTVVSADAGGVPRTRAYSKRLNNAPMAILDKRRSAPGEAEVMNIIGEIDGRDCLITEDMIDSAGTLIKASEAMKAAGAKSIYAVCTHSVFSKNAVERLEASPIDKIIITDTITKHIDLSQSTKIEVVSVAGLIGDAIKNIHEGTSISSLYV